jgi:1,2-phenylacetyl-CoA epoxidase PaaB subunit
MKRPSKRSAAPLYEWRIVRLKSTPAALVGYVNAPDQEQAIAEAIEAFGISDLQRQSRLSAYKVREVRP